MGEGTERNDGGHQENIVVDSLAKMSALNLVDTTLPQRHTNETRHPWAKSKYRSY